MNYARPPQAMATPGSSGRNGYIDTLRGWSIFGVVCIHFAGSFVTTDIHVWSPSFFLGLTLNQIFIFAVPLFVFLSGLLAGTSTKPIALGDYYRSRARRVGFPYLLASIASFFLLNHYAEWLALPDLGTKFTWLLQRFFFFGVEPTLYFIPLILQLYFLQPALKALPGWLAKAVPAISADRFALLLAAMLLVLHVSLGVMCNRGTLDYYVWGRPNALFWMFYFFTGLHFRSLASLMPKRSVQVVFWLSLVIAAGAMAWNFNNVTNLAVVGDHFEANRLDFAYVRPEMLIYDLAMVAVLAAGLTFGWNPRPGIISYVGRYTLEIYLWHILVLYFGAWRYAEALASCRRMPELMIIIATAACLLIAFVAEWVPRITGIIRQHRLVVVRTEQPQAPER